MIIIIIDLLFVKEEVMFLVTGMSVIQAIVRQQTITIMLDSLLLNAVVYSEYTPCGHR